MDGRHLRLSAAAARREQVLISAHFGYDGPVESPDKLAAMRETLSVLDQLVAPHALIGGLAVGIHAGQPRATLDIDLAVRSTVGKAELIRKMQNAGFRLVGQFEHSINFRHASGEPVQFAIDASFDVMIDRAENIEVEGMSIRIVTKEDLISMKKRAAADPARRKSKALRDQADIELLSGDVPDPDEGW